MLEVKRSASGGLLAIGEVAKHFGVAVSALRYYDELGILPPAERRASGRCYGLEQLERLALIQLLQGGHLTLQEIGALIAGPDDGRAWHAVLADRIAALDEEIARAQRAKALLEHSRSCPRENPVAECPLLGREVRERVADALGDARADPTG